MNKHLKDLDESTLHELLIETSHAIKATFNCFGIEMPLFALIVFNDPKATQYIANCQREDMIDAMRETANRLERKQDVPR